MHVLIYKQNTTLFKKDFPQKLGFCLYMVSRIRLKYFKAQLILSVYILPL